MADSKHLRHAANTLRAVSNSPTFNVSTIHVLQVLAGAHAVTMEAVADIQDQLIALRAAVPTPEDTVARIEAAIQSVSQAPPYAKYDIHPDGHVTGGVIRTEEEATREEDATKDEQDATHALGVNCTLCRYEEDMVCLKTTNLLSCASQRKGESANGYCGPAAQFFRRQI